MRGEQIGPADREYASADRSARMRIRRTSWSTAVLFIAGLCVAVVAVDTGVFEYRIHPRKRFATFAGFLEAGGPPDRATRLTVGGKHYWRVSRRVGSLLPQRSSDPEYVFDGEWRLVAWSPDPDADPRHLAFVSPKAAIEEVRKITVKELIREFEQPAGADPANGGPAQP